MRNTLRSFGRDVARRAVARARPDLAVVPIRRLRDARLREIAGALHDGATGAVADDERAWVERIESVRTRTLTSSETVTDEDGGQRTVGAITRQAAQTPEAACVLLKLVRAWRPNFAIELGTGVGLSGAYLAAGMALNGRGRLVTIERSAELADVARRNFAELALDNVEVVVGTFEDALGRLLEQDRVDFAFVDGDPELKPTLRYFDLLWNAAADDLLCVLDDVDSSDDMEVAWRRISRHGPVEWSATHDHFGVCRVRV